jgi:hypothetical protein
LDIIQTGEDIEEKLADLLGNFSSAMEVVSWAGNAVQDVYGVLWVIAACTAIALVLSLVWLFLLRLFAGVLVWSTVLLSIAVLAGLTYVCWGQWHDKFAIAHKIEGYTFGFVSTELNGKVIKILFFVFVAIDASFL